MSIGGVFLGLINIAIVVVLLLLLGVLAWWIFSAILHLSFPNEARQLYIALIGLIALYMIVALFFGLPSVNVFPFR